jgi:heme-degrading monooxygenase HmoA
MEVSAMNEPVLTEVSAIVAAENERELITGFQELLGHAFPDGLLRTELLRTGTHWRIQTLWRDRATLDAMRAASEPPAAPALFRRIGADPSLEILTVVATAAGRSEVAGA